MPRLLTFLTCLFLLLPGASVVAQTFSITKVERISDQIVLHYDLMDTVASRRYTINLYSSSDSFTTPLEKVAGDIGLEVKPGGNRRIIWKARDELGAAFAGNVRLEVRGKVYVPFVKLDGFDDYKVFKRKKSYKVTWTGGRGNSVLNFDLYRGDKRITSYPNIANVGYHNLVFADVKPGKNYRLRISDAKNKDDVVYSAPFRIRRKVPLLLKVVPMAAVGYLVYSLSAGADSAPGGEPDIIDPPVPGN